MASITAKVWSGGDRYTLDTAPAAVREAILAAVGRGRASGTVTVDATVYKWGDLRADNGQPILDSRAYSDEEAGTLPDWMRTPTGD